MDQRKAIGHADSVNQAAADLVGMPMWNPFGAQFVSFLNTNYRTMQAVNLTSEMNPSLSGKYTITDLTYNLTSRGVPFYVEVYAALPA